MALKHLATIFCESIIHDNEDKFSYIKTFKNVVGTALPITRSQVGIVVEFDGENGDPFQVTLERPDTQTTVLIAEGIYDPPVIPGTDNKRFSYALISSYATIHAEIETNYLVVLRSGEEVIHSAQLGVFVQNQPSDTSAPLED